MYEDDTSSMLAVTHKCEWNIFWLSNCENVASVSPFHLGTSRGRVSLSTLPYFSSYLPHFFSACPCGSRDSSL